MAKIKKMCKIDKDFFKKEEDRIIAEVLHPKFICKKCFRTATDKDLLCAPKKLEKKKD